MSWWSKITGSGATSVVDSIGRTASVFLGDKGAREHNQHSENMAVHRQHASEYQYRGQRTWFDSLVDGANRLVRPAFTYGMLSMFGWATWGSKDFLDFTARLATIPDALWVIQGTILAFWFGSRSIYKDRYKYQVDPKYIQSVYDTADKIRTIQHTADEKASNYAVEHENQTLREFAKRHEPRID